MTIRMTKAVHLIPALSLDLGSLYHLSQDLASTICHLRCVSTLLTVSVHTVTCTLFNKYVINLALLQSVLLEVSAKCTHQPTQHTASLTVTLIMEAVKQHSYVA